MGISKNDFKAILKALMDQYDYDKARTQKLSEIYGSDVMPSDNSRLSNALFKILHKTFAPEDGFCSIQAFCYDLGFGRSIGLTFDEGVDQLWEGLISKIEVEFEEVESIKSSENE